MFHVSSLALASACLLFLAPTLASVCLPFLAVVMTVLRPRDAAPHKNKPEPRYCMVAQYSEGGRQWVWDRYIDLDEAEYDAVCEFNRDKRVVCCVVVYLEEGFPGFPDAVCTYLPDGRILEGCVWQAPLLKAGESVREDIHGARYVVSAWGSAA